MQVSENQNKFTDSLLFSVLLPKCLTVLESSAQKSFDSNSGSDIFRLVKSLYLTCTVNQKQASIFFRTSGTVPYQNDSGEQNEILLWSIVIKTNAQRQTVNKYNLKQCFLFYLKCPSLPKVFIRNCHEIWLYNHCTCSKAFQILNIKVPIKKITFWEKGLGDIYNFTIFLDFGILIILRVELVHSVLKSKIKIYQFKQSLNRNFHINTNIYCWLD